MTVFGAQQVLRFLFYVPGDVLGEIGREVVVNGIALLVVGTPIWVYAWRVIQDSLADGAEMGSVLRLGILYALALGGVITVLTSGFIVVNTILMFCLSKLFPSISSSAKWASHFHRCSAWNGVGILRILAQPSHRSGER
jgi:hypothetical protein